ncbi:MAG: hypothetical protein L6Q81_10595 [Bacteroidia bacterium]|nr:hypothetical protein [Bacteroidia bacterium]
MRHTILLLVLTIQYSALLAQGTNASDNEQEFTPRRGWMVKAGYGNQISKHWVEAGFGRINLIGMRSSNKPGSFVSAAAGAFNISGEYCLNSSRPIYGAKLGIEGHALLFGARASFAMYFREGQESGVATLEGGLCLFSTVYVYAGYNFADQPIEQQVINEGFRLSAGVNLPFGMKTVKTNQKLKSD